MVGECRFPHKAVAAPLATEQTDRLVRAGVSEWDVGTRFRLLDCEFAVEHKLNLTPSGHIPPQYIHNKTARDATYASSKSHYRAIG